MAAPIEPSCRLYAILARDGRSAAVFRRGPSRQVLVLRWWLEDDRLEPGQWLKGRIYERRCDLSPNGDLLLYFAAKWETPLATWTAVSRTPYLTALALWPKGDAWGGGGVFEDATTVGLNHFAVRPAFLPNNNLEKWHPLGREKVPALPGHWQVRRWGEDAGRGEDNPIQAHRMMRDGWVCIAEGDPGPHLQSEYAWLFRAPEIWERKSPIADLSLRRILRAIYQKNGPWYVEDFEVCDAGGRQLRRLENCSWADWQSSGDLLFALDASLYRLPASRASEQTDQALDGAALVADLSPLRFQNVQAPVWARQWP